jgi:hypothetical protein
VELKRIPLLVLTAVGCCAGALLAFSAFLPAEGENLQFPLEGPILEAMPGLGALLIGAGAGIVVACLLALETGRPAWALTACGLAVVAAVSLDGVDYHYRDAAIERTQSLWEIRGDGAVVAAASAAAGAAAALALAGVTFAYARREGRRTPVGPGDLQERGVAMEDPGGSR